MKPHKFVRPLTEDERTTLENGCRASDAFTVRRCQMLLARAEGQSPSTIARHLRCARQTVYNGLDAFAERGLDCLRPGSHVPVSVAPVLTAAKREHLQAILHQSPRNFGKAPSHWTLQLLATGCYEHGLSERPLSPPTLLEAVGRLGASWQRAKPWIVSPDPAYARKKSGVTGSSASPSTIQT
jgi:transposase